MKVIKNRKDLCKSGQLEPEILTSLLKGVAKPARYLGGEWNAIRKDPRQVKVKVVLAFPDTYEVGMSSLGLRILYYRLNRQPDILAERVFAPWPDLEHLLREKNLPLFSLESRRSLAEFDIIGFSLLYELNYTNVLTILDLAGLPLLSRKRGNGHPLVIAGGPACFNPEPLADFIDAFFIGDGEEAILEIVTAFQAHRESGGSRPELLRSLVRIKGMYVPRFYQSKEQASSPLVYVEPVEDVPPVIEKRTIFDLNRAPYPEKTIVPSTEIIFDRVQVEVARGCPQSCRFCQATSLYFPHRFRKPDKVKKLIRENLETSGYDEVSLTALSVSDYPRLVPLVDELMSELSPEKVAVSLPSLRPGGVSEEVVDSILKVRKTGLTIVPEAGTERLRRVINKHLTDEDIWEASQAAFSRGWRLLKLYFMVGLPTETEEDLQGIVRIVEEILKIGVRYLRVPPQINLSISSFIPKPHTPFQWVAMDSPELLEKKINFLKSQLRKYRSVRFKDHPVDNSVLEAVFSRGDRRLAPVILRAWERGARFDSWSDTFDFSLWEEAFNQIGIDYREYLEAIPTEAHLPWEHLRTGLKRMALLRELRRAYQAEWTPSCLERECRFCLGCDFPGEVNKILQAEREIKSQKEPAREREKSGGGRKGSAEEVSFNQRATTAARDGSLKQQEKEQEKGKESSKRYRFFFTKSGPARFISHLDLINTIQRLLRRARVPAEFSKGFHPKMKLTFLPALPLGMGSQEEVFELRTWSRLDEKNILSRLNSVSPEGISFKRLEEVSQQQPSLNREIKAVLYSLDIETLLDHLRRREGKKKEGRPAKKELDAAQIGELIAQKLDKYTKEVIVAPEEKKIYLLYLVKEGELGNPYRLLQELFNWEEAVFSLVREKVFFKENWREVWLKNQ